MQETKTAAMAANMKGKNTMTEENTTPATDPVQVSQFSQFKCFICDPNRLFKNQLALTMHINRVHTQKIKVPSQKGGKGPQTKAQQLEARRIRQKALRARYREEGKDSHGRTRPPGWKPRKSPVVKSSGAKWTAARRKKFNATWEAKKNGFLPKPEPKQEDPRGFFNHCPNCGHNLVAHYLAAGAARRHAK